MLVDIHTHISHTQTHNMSHQKREHSPLSYYPLTFFSRIVTAGRYLSLICDSEDHDDPTSDDSLESSGTDGTQTEKTVSDRDQTENRTERIETRPKTVSDWRLGDLQQKFEPRNSREHPENRMGSTTRHWRIVWSRIWEIQKAVQEKKRGISKFPFLCLGSCLESWSLRDQYCLRCCSEQFLRSITYPFFGEVAYTESYRDRSSLRLSFSSFLRRFSVTFVQKWPFHNWQRLKFNYIVWFSQRTIRWKEASIYMAHSW